jgi:ParB-like chromosome segregation protein Spo0J
MTSTTSGTETTDQHRGMPVHPVADLFPMLPDDELKDLAADITERGLLQPIVLDKDGCLLDGRNRYAACQLAGIEPTFTTYDGDDPEGYALAVNAQRRDLTKSQRAMVAARAARRPQSSSNLEDWGDQVRLARLLSVTESRISEALLVLEWCDATTINAAIAGDQPLYKAVEEARRLKQEDADREAKKARLRKGAPDLLARVGEEVLSLDDAIAALDAREEKARQEAAQRASKEAQEEAQRESERRAAISNLRSVLTYLTSTVLTSDELAADYADVVGDFLRQDLVYAARTMTAIAKSREVGPRNARKQGRYHRETHTNKEINEHCTTVENS